MLHLERYNVRIVRKGDKYGRDDCLTNEGEPLVEFYDSRFDKHGCWMGRGQFVSRYYVSTILGGEYPNGLSLDGGIPEWTVSAEDMAAVQTYLKEQA